MYRRTSLHARNIWVGRRVYGLIFKMLSRIYLFNSIVPRTGFAGPSDACVQTMCFFSEKFCMTPGYGPQTTLTFFAQGMKFKIFLATNTNATYFLSCPKSPMSHVSCLMSRWLEKCCSFTAIPISDWKIFFFLRMVIAAKPQGRIMAHPAVVGARVIRTSPALASFDRRLLFLQVPNVCYFFDSIDKPIVFSCPHSFRIHVRRWLHQNKHANAQSGKRVYCMNGCMSHMMSASNQQGLQHGCGRKHVWGDCILGSFVAFVGQMLISHVTCAQIVE
jgi:hypothetical protein